MKMNSNQEKEKVKQVVTEKYHTLYSSVLQPPSRPTSKSGKFEIVFTSWWRKYLLFIKGSGQFRYSQIYHSFSFYQLVTVKPFKKISNSQTLMCDRILDLSQEFRWLTFCCWWDSWASGSTSVKRSSTFERGLYITVVHLSSYSWRKCTYMKTSLVNMNG